MYFNNVVGEMQALTESYVIVKNITVPICKYIELRTVFKHKNKTVYIMPNMCSDMGYGQL